MKLCDCKYCRNMVTPFYFARLPKQRWFKSIVESIFKHAENAARANTYPPYNPLERIVDFHVKCKGEQRVSI